MAVNSLIKKPENEVLETPLNKIDNPLPPANPPPSNTTQVCASNCCGDCKCDKCSKDYRDALLSLLEEHLKSYNAIAKKIIGILLSVLTFFIVLIIIYFAFPAMKIWKKFSWLDYILSLLKFMPAEFYISLGFITASLTNLLHKYVEIFLLACLSLGTIFWAYMHGQWLALGAGSAILLYGILRTGAFNSYYGTYFLGLFRYITWIVFGLLIGNFFLNFAKSAGETK